jgi:hypothetical protein
MPNHTPESPAPLPETNAPLPNLLPEDFEPLDLSLDMPGNAQPSNDQTYSPSCDAPQTKDITAMIGAIASNESDKPNGPANQTDTEVEDSENLNTTDTTTNNQDQSITSNQDRKPWLLRFFDSFLDERNIKWLLGIGTLILLGSSLMLVTSHWQTYTPIWKYSIMLGYTALIALGGWITYHKLLLRKTGTMLLSLTVLLLPVLFLALHWVHSDRIGSGPDSNIATDTTSTITTSTWSQVIAQMSASPMHLLLLAITTIFATVAASHVFKLLLRKQKLSFLLSYLTLCIAGSLVPLFPTSVAIWIALGLWCVFALGSVKVNRHVFWLTEAHRRPRITGFFPIALLGGQFLCLYLLFFAPHISLQWAGLGCALTAMPILLTADAVARVFQERGEISNIINATNANNNHLETNNPSRQTNPFPAAIVLPIITALTLCAAAVAMSSASYFVGQTPFALTPTGIVVTICLVATANSTGKSALTWVGLLAATIAYYFSPVFFKQFALQAIAQTADMIQEPRLPIAFYGLTFLPLIITFTALSHRLRNRPTLAIPLRWYSVVLATATLALSIGHSKAMLPVSAVMMCVFAWQTWMYRKPLLAALSMTAYAMVAIGATRFAEQIVGHALAPELPMYCVIAASAILFLFAKMFDGQINRLQNKSGITLTICQTTSLALTLTAVACWLVTFGITFSPLLPIQASMAALMLTSLLLMQCIRLRQTWLAGTTMVFAYFVTIRCALAIGADWSGILSVGAFVLYGQWLLARLPGHAQSGSLRRCFAKPAEYMSAIAMILIGGCVMLPSFIAQTSITPQLTELSLHGLSQIALIAWCFDAACRYKQHALTAAGCILTYAGATTLSVNLFGTDAYRWLPALWASIATLSLLIAHLLRQSAQLNDNHNDANNRTENTSDAIRSGRRTRTAKVSPYSVLIQPLEHITFFVLGLVAIGSLLIFNGPMHIAGLIATAGLLISSVQFHSAGIRVTAMTLVNWQVIAGVFVLIDPARLENILDLRLEHLGSASVYMALIAAASLLIWQRVAVRSNEIAKQFASTQKIALRFLIAIMIYASLWTVQLPWFAIAAGFTVFVLIAVGEVESALRNQSSHRVWFAQSSVALGVMFLVHRGALSLNESTLMFALLGVTALLSIASRNTEAHSRLAILSKPLSQAALLLPAAVVWMGFLRHVLFASDADMQWLAINTLALFLAAGSYFWHGIESKKSWALLLSAAIANITMILLWNELPPATPQLYMVPIGVTVILLTRLLRHEIPAKFHDALYYAGALIALVSPTFHIVQGEWQAILSLMVLSVAAVLLAIGFRIRPLVYTGSAFLFADLVALVIRSSVDNKSLLWISGIALGCGVIAIGAVAERNRELLLQKLRRLSATLEAWE